MIDALFKCLRPFVDRRTGIAYTCGTCPACRKQKKAEWVLRCHHELLYNNCKATYATLTYDYTHLKKTALKPENDFDKLGTLCRDDLYKFLKRLRLRYPGKKLRYFACGEYGTKRWRPHYHILIFGLNPDECSSEITQCWSHGYVDISLKPVSDKVSAYIVGYVTKKMDEEFPTRAKRTEYYTSNNREAPFLSFSKGLGGEWADIHVNQWIHSLTFGFNSRQVPVPRYYMIRQFKKEGYVRKIKTSSYYVVDNRKTESIQYKVVKNPEGDNTLKILRKLQDIRMKKMSECKDRVKKYLPDFDFFKIEFSLKNMLNGILQQAKADYEYYFNDSIEYNNQRIVYPPKSRRPVYEPSVYRIARNYARQRLYNVTHGIGNNRAYFDDAYSLTIGDY